jgi:alpha-L-fucosidase
MYTQGSGQNKFHVQTYGHPSKVGFKDICNLWKAEKWDPEKLIALYRRAGAKYFVALANHHCNFDCYASKYQPWNSVAIGPKKDIVGGWATAARKAGLRFGVTVHAARSWNWYEVAQGADATGPMQGIAYDGKLTKADGKGQWWEGLDPQDLYAQNHRPGEKPSPAYCEKFFQRTLDLIDSYQPDLLYFDDGVLPLNGVDPQYGLRIAAHYYNASAAWHGANEAVMNTKGLNPDQRKALVWDIERGKSDHIEPYPWQTDTCIGGWHYSRGTFEHHSYKTPSTVIQMLVDIVSKNGNLLLNIPVRGDGTIDEDEVQCLEGIAEWMAVNGEAIFATRPWKVYGEGAREARAGNFNEGKGRPYTAADLRYTTKGDTLYAIALAWPADGKLTLKSLGSTQAGIRGEVASVELLGAGGKLAWNREPAGLVVTLPAEKPCQHAWVLKIRGLDLAASKPAEFVEVIPFYLRADKKGSYHLNADDADLHGKRIKLRGHGSKAELTNWDDAKDWASWNLEAAGPGKFEVTVRCSAAKAAGEFDVEVAGKTLAAQAAKTSAWDDYQVLKLGRVEIPQAGKYTVAVRPHDAATWKPINLAYVKLSKK